ncbi:MAG TPA: DinB family protein [Candidatus Acidoferrum sp.]|nr:DinB family protein [Candidatus Acidoferrum sp.]
MKKKKRASKPAKKTGKKGARGTDGSLREQLVYLLKGGGAHVHFMDALEGFPAGKYGVFANALPHTGWQLLEHVRIAQWDILEFSRNPKHVSPDFPGGYWPKTPMPPNERAWDESVAAFQRDLQAMVGLVNNPRTDLFSKIPHGEGQTVLREAMVLADHNSYHLGQLVDLRRALGVWPEP